jgi:hypothetical protein
MGARLQATEGGHLAVEAYAKILTGMLIKGYNPDLLMHLGMANVGAMGTKISSTTTLVNIF